MVREKIKDKRKTGWKSGVGSQKSEDGSLEFEVGANKNHIHPKPCSLRQGF